ncbi:MAG: alpha/beta fold hydrolase, partial [Trebonia sp.]
APEQVKRLVPIEGWMSDDGSSMFSLAPDWFATGIRQAAGENGDGWRIPAPAPELAGVTDPDDVTWLAAQLTDQPLRSFTDATRLTGAIGSVEATAIIAPPALLPFATWSQRLGYDTVTLEGGHDLMVTSPVALATTLDELA